MVWVLMILWHYKCNDWFAQGDCIEWRQIGVFDTYQECHAEELKHDMAHDKTFCDQKGK